MKTTMKRTAILYLFVLFSSVAFCQNLKINEIQVANIDMFIDPSYNYGGWIELYNPKDISIQLKNHTIKYTDTDQDTKFFSLTAKHGIIQPHGYAVIWFDHNIKDGQYGPSADTQVPFKLDPDGGIIELLDETNILIDKTEYSESISRCSLIRTTDGSENWGWTSYPSPGETNNNSTVSKNRLNAPIINTAGGVFYDSFAFNVDIPKGATLYFTTDGACPTIDNCQISKDGHFEGNETSIYRFMLVKDGMLNSPIITRTFIKGSFGCNLPILSVTTAPPNLFDNNIGIYVRGSNGIVANNSGTASNINMDWERPVNIEYFVPSNSQYTLCLNQEADMAICGGYSRYNPGIGNFEYRPSFHLKSDKKYDSKNSFDYPIFKYKPYNKTKNFIVRNGGQDYNSRIKDISIHEIIRSSGLYLDCQTWQSVHTFINGEYLGMMNLREESNRQFAYSNYGIDKDEINSWEGENIIKFGDDTSLMQWTELANDIKTGGDASWESIDKLIDVDEFCNYMATETFLGNNDWMILANGNLKNIKGFRAITDGGKIHLVFHDLDGAFFYTDLIKKIIEGNLGPMLTRFRNMLNYEPFRKQYIDAFCILNGSIFEEKRCLKIINEIKESVTPALALENNNAEWTASWMSEQLKTDSKWRKETKDAFISALNLSDEYNINLSSTTSGGSILLNNQEIPTGKFNGYLFPPITLMSIAPSGQTFEGWCVDGNIISTDSILEFTERFPAGNYRIEAVYKESSGTKHAPIIINEVSSGNDIYINDLGKKTDWIELYNTTENDYDLSGIYISDNKDKFDKNQINNEIGINTIIPAHGYKVIWCDGKAGKSQLHTNFKLSNSDNSAVYICSKDNTWSDSLVYKAQSRWQTYGRYPDAGGIQMILERPSIGSCNHICTYPYVQSGGGANIENLLNNEITEQIKEINYYNLDGQQVYAPDSKNILIKVIILNNGNIQTSKILIP